MRILEGKRILITGGTGSLGKVLCRRLLAGDKEKPAKIVVFSRDVGKQQEMLMQMRENVSVSSRYGRDDLDRILQFFLGDVRDPHAVVTALRDVDVVINAAAIKHVPRSEYAPFEAVKTNVGGAENIIRAIREFKLDVEVVLGVSTDKACKPTNVMGLTKAIMEKLFVHANLECGRTDFLCVRYGNVLASSCSVIPIFHEQIRRGGPLTVTTPEMTRFFITPQKAVETILEALKAGVRGETLVPVSRSARMQDVARALIGERDIKIKTIGIRPGEKEHEELISVEEAGRTSRYGDFFVIGPALTELVRERTGRPALDRAYSSDGCLMSFGETERMLIENDLLIDVDAAPSAS